MNLDNFTALELNSHSDTQASIYTCSCGESTSLKLQDFMKHWNSDLSNLTEEDRHKIDKGTSVLDFYCTKCKSPTTITYVTSAGGQHGEYWVNITNVYAKNQLA